MADEEQQDFYVRYYVGHKGKFGHEFLEFEFRPDGKSFCKNSLFFIQEKANYFILLLGKLRYANNSNYKNDTMIRKEVRENYSTIIFSQLLNFF